MRQLEGVGHHSADISGAKCVEGGLELSDVGCRNAVIGEIVHRAVALGKSRGVSGDGGRQKGAGKPKALAPAPQTSKSFDISRSHQATT